ncbi:MAG: CBS domain-containing protein [Chitinophagales bacterium]|nr:CBS domain-containing protein [Chitinophagales bacterium]
MLASDIISTTIPPLKTSDSGEKAIEWMYEFKLTHLPLVENKKYIGLVSEDDILDFNNTKEQLGKYLKNLNKPYVIENEHMYDVLRLAVNLRSTVIPVVDTDMNYLGIITMESILHHFAKMSSISDPGGIIILELNSKNDYVLSDIARIVESNDAHILSMALQGDVASGKQTVTIKVDVAEIKHIIATFERFDYVVQAYFDESDMNEVYKDRYDSLMNYLNI